MSIKIHHGPPGSYKTSGAVMDDFVAAALAGRVIVTNVRGLDKPHLVRETLNKTRKFPKFWQFNAVPDSFDIIWVDTTTKEGRGKFATFFHWIPLGAFLLVDEAQMVFPLAWKDSHLKLLDFPDGLLAAAAKKRPPDFLTAFEMHRHYGWDMVLTTPNISKIRTDIRGCAEGAYKHKNQALLGLKGRYLEAFHLAEDNGKSNSDFLSVRGRKIKSYVWELYASTTTGTHSDTIAGTPLWANPRVVFIVALFALFTFFLVSRKPPAIISAAASSSSKVGVSSPVSSTPVALVVDASAVQASAVSSSVNPISDNPFKDYKWRVAAVIKSGQGVKIFYQLSTETETVLLSSHQLPAYGFSFQYFDDCHSDITFKGSKPFSVYCSKDKAKINFNPVHQAVASF